MSENDGAPAADAALPLTPAWVGLAAAIVRRLPAGRYRLITFLCRRPPPPFLMHMRPELGGAAYHCDLRDAVSREVCFAGKYEPQETAIVQSILRQGMTFVDVGANWGYFTLLAAHLVGPTGRILSLEPDPRLFSLLREAAERNRLHQVTALQVAAAHTVATLKLAGFDETSGNFGVSHLLPNGANAGHCYDVSAEPLDAILQQRGLHTADLMKIDIEGAEDMALQGLQDSLNNGKVKRVLLELHPVQLAQQGSSPEAVAGRLERAGYRGYRVDHSKRATRAAAYGTTVGMSSLLHPIGDEPLDAWPHQLWLAPGITSP
jgi:FkbM family methyltransferase